MRLLTAGVVIGTGLGGFVDGIVLHLAQWHNTGSAVVPPVTMPAMSLNVRWDGLFHAGTWITTLAGVYMLWADAGRHHRVDTAGALTGQLIFGWGVFNLIEA